MEKNKELQKQARPDEMAIKGAITKPDVEGEAKPLEVIDKAEEARRINAAQKARG